ncbi:zinc-binding dehydrogenase [Xenophilus aerolatus]
MSTAALPTTMRAAVQAGADGVRVQTVPLPRPGPTEILVRVRASALNRADLGLAEGRRHGPHGGPGTVLGLEWAGEVVSAGWQVDGVRPGDRVMCSGIGAFAEYAVTDYRRSFPLPHPAMDTAQAACLPIALRTMHDALVTQGGLRAGQSVLIQGASSGVGLMGLQLARHLGAGLVLGTSTTPERRGRLADFGAHRALDTTDPRWVEAVLAHTGGRGVDLVIDQLSGPYASLNLQATAIGGCVVNVGRMAGQSAVFDFETHSMRRIRYQGVTFRTRSVDEVAAIAERVRAHLWPALAAGQLGLPIDVRLPLEAVPQALARMRANDHFGKIVIEQPA